MKKLQVNKNGYYSVKFRVSIKLIKYFKKSIISKSLGTKDLNKANIKADIIKNKYNDLLKVVDLLDSTQIQILVNKYIKDTLEQDKISRAINGYGLVGSEFSSDVISGYLEETKIELAENNYQSVIQVATELLSNVGIVFDNNNTSHRLLLQNLMRANIEVYEEAYNRCFSKYNPKYDDTLITQPINKEIKQFTTVKDGFERFMKWYKKQDINTETFELQTNRLMNVILPTLDGNKDITKITIDDIEELKEFITTYPNTNILPYKRMSYDEIYDYDVPEEAYISPATQKKYLQITKQAFNYLSDVGCIEKDPTIRLSMPSDNGNSWLPYSIDEINDLFNIFETLDDRKYIYYTLAYTGMRPAEFWKCNISFENDIAYFDLTDKKLSLKTKTSYRKIPLHNKLLEMGIDKKLDDLQIQFKQYYISKYFNETILNNLTLENSDKKIMYSFRHTVATTLKRLDVISDKISELLGHSYLNTSITKEVYQDKYSLKQLKEALDVLNYSIKV